MSTQTYLKPSNETGKNFYMKEIPGSFVMLNLLKFRPQADYSEHPELQPATLISGLEAYSIYIREVTPLLQEIGSEVLFRGEPREYLVGPTDESWNLLLLVKHRSKVDFLSFASSQRYLAIVGHRNAALQDSRLMPIVEDKPAG